MPSSTTVPATPATGGTSSPGTTSSAGIPDCKLLKVTQAQFTKHTSINDLHQSLNTNYGDSYDAESDINTLFTNSNRTEIKRDTELINAVRRLVAVQIIVPCAAETADPRAKLTLFTLVGN